MKKIISLALMLVFVLLALVSCGGDELTPIPEHYPKDTNNEESIEEIDLYIIVGEGTAEKALDPVKKYISNKTQAKLNVKLNVKYITEDEYQSTVKGAIDDKSIIREYTVDEKNSDGTVEKVTKKAGAVVLLNSFDFMVELSNTIIDSTTDEETGETIDRYALLDLSTMIYDKAFASLNDTVPKPLMKAAMTVEGKLYAIPNVRTLGEYTYLVIDEEIACKTLKFSPGELAGYKTYEDTAELRQAMVDNGYNPDEYVQVKTGTYSDKAKFISEGNVCNVISVPSVTAKDAFSSAFAVIDSGDAMINERAMRVIYALNENEEIRNILQYGIEHTNYTVENGVVVRKTGNDAYYMNYVYTGNAFILLHCEEIGWTADDVTNGNNQNKDVVLAS